MLKKILNEIIFDFKITPEDPILIKSGMAMVGGVDMSFVQTTRNGKKEFYLPGSSLKGVIRSHCEKILKTLKENSVCNIFQHEKSSDPLNKISCGERFKQEENHTNREELNKYVYKESCLACRLFGSTFFSSRFHISDAYINNGNAPSAEIRDGVGIDRFTGGAADRAKFELEVITGGEFKCSLHIRNFEIYQLGIIACVLKDFEDALIYVGSGKSRGLGRVKGQIIENESEGFKINYFQKFSDNKIKGLGALVSEKECPEYGLFSNDHIEIPELSKLRVESGNPLKSSFRFDERQRNNLFKLAVENMNSRLSAIK